MAAPVYATDLTAQELDSADTTTGWSEPGAPETGGGTPQNGTEFFIQGSACVSKACAGAGGITGGVLYNEGTPVTIASGDAVYIWLFFAAPNTLLTRANGGFAVCIGSSTTAYRKWYVLGNDNYQYSGWQCIAVDPAVAGDLDIGSPNMGSLQYFGAVVKTSATISKGEPFGVDAIRHGRTFTTTEGSVADGFGTFAGAAAANDAVSARWGQFQAIAGGYQMQGRFLLGTAGTAVDFRDANTSVLVANTLYVSSGFNLIEVRNASSRVDFTAVNFLALGTVSRGNFLVTDNADVNIDSCSFTQMGTFVLKANTTILDSTLRSCDTITANGAVLNGSSVLTSRVAADESALLWDVADGDPDGNLDNMTFSKGTNAHHAISLTPNAATTDVTLRGITFIGFYGVEGSTAENSAVLELEDRGADTTWNINLVGTTGAISYKKRRATDTVNLISGSVTLTVTVVDIISGDPIEGVNVLVEAAAGGGMAQGTDIIKAFTDVNGQVSDTRAYGGGDQPITGRARLASGAGPYYKTGSIAGLVSASADTDITVQMILDT